MKLPKIFKRKGKVEKKNKIINNIVGIINELSQNASVLNAGSLTFNKMIDYYLNVAPLSQSINMIADYFSQIPIALQNKGSDEFIYQHKLLDLLKAPNADFTGTEFKKQIAAFMLIAGNSFIEATGAVEREPLELFSKGPQFFSITANNNDGFAESYEFNGFTNNIVFDREEVEGRFRYYDSLKVKELWHMRNFNPNFSGGSLFGISPMAPILMEIEQYSRSSNHNLSLLKNGARLSAMLLKEGVLSDEQYQRLKSQFNECYTGDSNAGRVMVAESGDGKLDLKELSQTNRDMDFKENKVDVRYGIFQNYKIPLPLVSPEHMTMDNYSEARLALLQDTVLPLTDRLLQELTNFLVPRYDDLSDNFMLSYNMLDIPALAKSISDEIAKKKETNIHTTNELRTLIGDEPIDGGDVIYQPINLVPIGSPTENKMIEKGRFIEILEKRGLPESEIKTHVHKYFRD